MNKVVFRVKSYFLVFLFCFSLFFSYISFAGVDRSQSFVLSKIRAYLEDLEDCGARKDLIKRFKRGGYCSAFSAVWLYSKWLQTQPDFENILIEDFRWFSDVHDKYIKWGIDSSNNNVIYWGIDGFYDLFNRVAGGYFQHNDDYDLNASIISDGLYEAMVSAVIDNEVFMRQERKKTKLFILLLDFLQNNSAYFPEAKGVQMGWAGVLEFTGGRKLIKKYHMESSFTLEELKKFLIKEDIFQYGEMIGISSKFHNTALFYDGDHYCYFDPNSSDGEFKTKSINDVARRIFKANWYNGNKSFPLIFQVFSFDGVYPPSHQRFTTTIMKFVTAKNVKMVRLLLEKTKGADINRQDVNGSTALIGAVSKGSSGIVKDLLEKGKDIDVNIKNDGGWSALLFAALNCFDTEVGLILEKGKNVDLSVRTNNGFTALDLAKRQGCYKVVELIQKF